MPKIDWAAARTAWEAGMSKNQVARTFGVSVTAITDHQRKEGWHKGDTPPPSVGDFDVSAVPQVALHDEVARLEAEVARLRAAQGKPETFNLPVLNTSKDVINLYGMARLKTIAAKQVNRTRKQDGFLPIEFDTDDPRLNAFVDETIQVILDRKTAEAGKNNLRTVKMVLPDKKQPGGGRLVALPVEANFNNEKANPGASIRLYRKKRFVVATPPRCMRGPCWAEAPVLPGGEFQFGGYCSAGHLADDPVANARKIGGITSTESIRMVPA